MSTARDAAILYCAINGTDAPLTCAFVEEDGDEECGKPMAGVSADDGVPLCAAHVANPEDNGHRLSEETLDAIRALRDRSHLGQAIAASASENGASAVDRRRLDDGARALAAVEPPHDDILAWHRYVDQLASAVAAMQSLDDLDADANTKAWHDLLALQDKWNEAERKLAELSGKRG